MPAPSIARLNTTDARFDETHAALLAFDAEADAGIHQAVGEILAAVRARGDEAVLEYTRRFDALPAPSMAALEISRNELQATCDALPAALRETGTGGLAATPTGRRIAESM